MINTGDKGDGEPSVESTKSRSCRHVGDGWHTRANVLCFKGDV